MTRKFYEPPAVGDTLSVFDFDWPTDPEGQFWMLWRIEKEMDLCLTIDKMRAASGG